MSNLAKDDYRRRIDRAVDYVTRHLDQPLKLDRVAKVAAFSPYHFHRIFQALMGETLHDFVKRTRLERALYLRSHTRRSFTEIALEVGFSSSSDFSRSFKAHFGTSPRQFDLAAWRARGAAPFPSKPVAGERFRVQVRDLPARRVAYRRVMKPFEAGKVERAAADFVRWATDRGLERGQWLGFMWDEPELVPLDKCRYDIGLVVPDAAALGEEVGEQRFPAMTVAELDFSGSLEREVRAFEWLYGQWLPRSGRSPEHHPLFEAWKGLPYAHGNEHFELRLQLAVTEP